METRPFIIATAGHVDHGKSALVCALTGTDPDRLPEEKARGITIDLGFAHLDIPGRAPAGGDVTFRLGIVDVPGHEDFVKNMVAGVGSIDLALLVVAADDGWMPQTEEHLQILGYLGVSHGVVALTKIDLAQSEQASRDAVREKLRGTALAEAPIIATSVVSDRGMDDLKAALAQVLSDLPTRRDVGKPRLSVDRAFTLHGVGTVITGTLTGGVLRRGQAVTVQPAGRPAKIRTVQTHNQEVEAAQPGSRVALNLPDLQIADRANTAQSEAVIGRGDVVTLPTLGRASDTLDVMLERSPRIGVEGGASRPLKEATLLRVHHGSGNFPARAYFADGVELRPGQRVIAQLRFDAPVFAFAGDRFILRDWPEQQTLGGGLVLDPDARRRGFRTQERKQFLENVFQSVEAVRPLLAAHLARDGAISRDVLLMKTRHSDADVAAAVERMTLEEKAILADGFVADAAWWKRLRTKAVAAVDAAHRDHPEQAGPRLADVKNAIERDMGRTDVFDSLLADLCKGEFVRQGASIRRATHRPALPAHLRAAGVRLRTALAAQPLDPPSRGQLAPDNASMQALRFLVQSGEAVEVGDELVLGTEGFTRAVSSVKDHLRQKGGATVSELRQVLGTSRRIMVPLLEKLDRDGVTLRDGDRRVLRSASNATSP